MEIPGDREHVGDDVIEDQRFLTNDRVAGEQSHDAIALLQSLEIGREVLEARAVRRCAAQLVKLNYG